MRRSLFLLGITACGASTAVAQLPQTRLYSVFPPGVTPGEITEIRLTSGADLDEVDRLIFSHPGIFATQKHQTGRDGQQQPVAGTFRVAVDESVPPGRYEVRAVGRFGASNPRPLQVDARRSVNESEPNNTLDQALQIDSGTLVNGQINGAGDVDAIRVSASRGERLIIDCLTSRINSRLNPVLTLADADGRPVAFAERRHGRDAMLAFDVPADGDYLIQLHDETYSGGSEHIYQLRVHTGPHIEFTMPPAGVAGTTGRFTLYGYNLPSSERLDSMAGETPLERLEVDIPVPSEAESLSGTPSLGAGLDTFTYRYSSEAGTSNSVRIGLTSPSTPVLVEQEPNNQADQAQQLPVPAAVGGQFALPRDVDVFTFDAKKGQSLWIEVVGQRSGVLFDPYLKLEQITTDDAGNKQLRELTKQDDVSTNLASGVFDTATDDPSYLLKVPEDGSYRITLRDRAFESRGDPSLVYRLIIRPQQPDFRLVATPSGQPSGLTWPASLRRGDHISLDILAFRRDGFTGPIEIRPQNLPFGLSTRGTVLREKETRGTLVLTAKDDAAFALSPVDLVGAASISTPLGDQTVERPVRFGSVVSSRNGNTPAISQLDSQFLAAVVPEPAPFQVTHEFSPLSVHQGRQLLIPMTALKRGFDEKLTLKFDDISKSAKIDKQDLTIDKGQAGQTLRLYIRPDSPPKQYLIGGTAQASVPYRRNPERAERLAVEKLRATNQSQAAKAIADEAAAVLQKQVQALEQATRTLQQSEKSLAEAQAKLAQTVAAADQAKQKSDETAKQVAALTEQAKQASVAASATAKAAGESEDPEAKAEAETAQQSAYEKQKALDAATLARTAATKEFEAAQAAATVAKEALATAQQQFSAAQAAQKSAEASKSAAAARSQKAAAAAKSAADARQAAEKAATDAANAAKAKNITVTQPIPPLIITVKPAPVALTAKPARLEIKQGESADVTVTVKRQNNFEGPLKISLALPEGVAGISAEEVSLAADAESAVLKLTADAKAAEGDMAHLVLRGVMDAGGEAIVDVPIELKVTK